jgi:uncharacterized membrane protein
VCAGIGFYFYELWDDKEEEVPRNDRKKVSHIRR